MAEHSTAKRTGRPKAQDAPVTVEQILDAAFRAFATYGYDGVAVRTLNRELGVTAFDPTLADPLDQLNYAIRRFVRYNADRPELLGMMNIEGRLESERLAYIYDKYIEPSLAPLGRLLEYLQAEGRIRPISLRALFFLVAHGAAAPFTLAPLARHFDDADPLDPAAIAEQAALTADVITGGLRLGTPSRTG